MLPVILQAVILQPKQGPPMVGCRDSPGLRLAVADALERRHIRQVEEHHVVIVAARVALHLRDN